MALSNSNFGVERAGHLAVAAATQKNRSHSTTPVTFSWKACSMQAAAQLADATSLSKNGCTCLS
jgi:hypothetical protein